jgi:hypothetical protein
LGAAIGLMPVTGRAQTSPQIESAEVHLWPEYDRAEVLVIYRILLASDTQLPTTLRLPIPAAVGEPHAVAVAGPGGALLNAPYQRTVAGDLAILAIEASSLQVQLEYYEPLARDGDRRSYVFRWPGGVEARSLAVEVQEPVGATDFQVDPPAAARRMGDLGLVYQRVEVGPVTAAQAPTVSLAYRKATGTLSAEALGAGSPLDIPATGDRSRLDWLSLAPWLVGAFGLVLVLVAGVWYLRLGRAGGGPPGERRRASRAAPDEGVGGPAPVYCHQCGTPASSSDRFCRHCGTRLRM